LEEGSEGRELRVEEGSDFEGCGTWDWSGHSFWGWEAAVVGQ
jgi:hypothetical protein